MKPTKGRSIPFGVLVAPRTPFKPIRSIDSEPEPRKGYRFHRVDMVKRTTDRAILFRLPDRREVWVPKSIISNKTTNQSGLWIELPAWKTF